MLPQALLFGLLAVGCAVGDDMGGPRAETDQLAVELIAGSSAASPGVRLRVGLRFELEEGWHIYWRNPGDSGLEPSVAWVLPEGCSASELSWPLPHRFETADGVNFGYEDHVVLLATIALPAELDLAAPLTIVARVDWLVCREECLPGSAELALSLPVQAQADLDIAPEVGTALKTLPVAAEDAGFSVVARRGEQQVTIALSPPDGVSVRDPVFFPAELGWMDNAGPQSAETRGRTIELTVPVDPRGRVPERVRGVISLAGWEQPGIMVDVELHQ